jgi:type I restriction enzyme M protein
MGWGERGADLTGLVNLSGLPQNILVYGYDVKRVVQFMPVTIGSGIKETDIIVYNDDAHHSAHIVVECKKQEVSKPEFEQAIKQAFSYAATGTVRARYFWVTSGIKDAYFEIPEKEPKKYNSIPDVPQYGVTQLAKYKYVKGGGVVNGQKLFELEVVTQDELTRRFKQAHNALWGGGELNPSEAFDELDKLIFCKIWAIPISIARDALLRPLWGHSFAAILGNTLPRAPL